MRFAKFVVRLRHTYCVGRSTGSNNKTGSIDKCETKRKRESVLDGVWREERILNYRFWNKSDGFNEDYLWKNNTYVVVHESLNNIT